MRLTALALVTLPLVAVGAGIAIAADLKSHADIITGAQVIEFGSFDCVADKSGGQATWDCPAQSFDLFNGVPIVYFSIGGLAHVPGSASLSVAIGTRGEVTREGFQPTLDATVAPPTGAETVSTSVNWIAVGTAEHRADEVPSSMNSLQ
jgi:hypothetical protein